MKQQSIMEGLDNGDLCAKLVAKGVDESAISVIDPIKLEGTSKLNQRRMLAGAADHSGATHADYVLVIHVAAEIKNGVKGNHARLYRNYCRGFKRSIQQSFLYPQVIFDKTTNTLLIDESALDIKKIVTIATHYFTHIIYQDVTLGNAVLIKGSANKRAQKVLVRQAYAMLDRPVSFRLDDISRGIQLVEDGRLPQGLKLMMRNTHGLIGFGYIKQTSGGLYNHLTRHSFLLVQAHQPGGNYRYYIFDPRSHFVEPLHAAIDCIIPPHIKKSFRDTISNSMEAVIAEHAGMAMPVSYPDNQHLDFANNLVKKLIGHVNTCIVEADIYNSPLFNEDNFKALYFDSTTSARIGQDKLSMIFDRSWLYDAHYTEIACSVVDALAIGVSKKLSVLGRPLSGYDPSRVVITMLLQNLASDSLPDHASISEHFFCPENISAIGISLDITVGESFIELLEDFVKGATNEVEGVYQECAYSFNDLDSLMSRILLNHWQGPLDKFIEKYP